MQLPIRIYGDNGFRGLLATSSSTTRIIAYAAKSVTPAPQLNAKALLGVRCSAKDT